MRYLALFVAILSVGAISSGNANAASTFDTYTDGDGVVWDRETNDDGDIYIGIKSVPSGITTVNVPSINDVASGKDTYFLDSICSRYATPDCSGVVADTANVTKLDMTNTSKIQVKNVSQMFDTNHEVELVFGENMVIADDGSSTAIGAFDHMKLKLTNLSNVKYIGWKAFANTILNASSRSITVSNNQTVGGYVFSGSNIESLSVDATEVGEGFAKDCTSLSSLTLGDNVTTLYGYVFQGTSALAQSIDLGNISTMYGHAFEDSAITSVDFGNTLSKIGDSAFKNTNLGAIDLSNTDIKKIGPNAFESAGVTSVNLGNIEAIGAGAFRDNSITEVYFPKTFRAVFVADEFTPYSQFAGQVFENNPIKKVTVAYDMATTDRNNNSNQPFSAILGNAAWASMEELIILAPYAADEAVSADHDGTTARQAWTGTSLPNDLINGAKNVIPSGAFQDKYAQEWGLVENTKKIIIDDRFEILGTGAFNGTKIKDLRTISGGVVSESQQLPSSLKAIGSHVFNNSITSSRSGSEAPIITIDTLPAGLEYIGACAFLYSNNFVLNTLDLPNLKYLGDAAFYMSNVKNVTLHEQTTFVSGNPLTFFGSDLLETVTIDFDFFGQTSNGFAAVFNHWLSGCNAGPNDITYSQDDWGRWETPGCASGTGSQHFTKITFTSKATTAPNANPANFMGIVADEIDLSATPWTSLYTYGSYSGAPGAFVGAKIGTLKLPSGLERINAAEFVGAEITEPLVIPDTVKEIGYSAFNASLPISGTYYPETTPGVKITSLPSSIEKIGRMAFLANDKFEADVDLPNLKELGSNAFSGTNVHNVHLYDSLETLGINAFYNTENLNDVTIDVNLYDVDIRDSDYDSVGFGEHYDENLTDEENYNADFYDSFVATFGDQNHKYGTITFTAKAGEPCGGLENCAKDRAYFYGIKADKIDLSATNWTTTSESMFQESEVGEIILPHALEVIEDDTFYNTKLGDVTLPTTLKTIDYEGFMRSTANIDGAFPEGLTTINEAAFYEADVTDDLVIPSTVTHLGQSAFNAGSEDVSYDTVTIKPNLTLAKTDNQLMFQLFYGSTINKLTVNSAELPATNINMADYDTPMPEFHGMTMDEVVITSLPKISKGAFEDCTNLKKADLSSDAALRTIDDEAFIRDAKLDEIYFSPSIKEETVTLGKYAFTGTAFTTMGDSSKQFDLTAANFDATSGYAFYGMPKLETVDVPRNFSNKTVPEATFANDTELRLVTIDYKVETIDDHAFSNDNKLESIFIWGNTEVEDSILAGHGGGNDQGRGADDFGPTIPEPTDIYAYSTSPAEDYAALPVRGTFEGDFYPLDEVLYLTSNKPTVLVNDDATDFDKDGLIVYAMRRDGIILESDSWATYDDNSYPRSESDVNFEHMAEVIQDNPVFGAIHDTPVPMNELDTTTNVNFANIGYTMVPDPEDSSVRKIVLLYNDKYTDNLADTDILPYQEGDPTPKPPVPDTGFQKAMKSFMNAGLPVVTIAIISLAGGVLIFKKRRS